MIKKKICLLGSYAVGKTSLINRYVNQSFSEKYHTTIGVKIDQKWVDAGDNQVQLFIWDIHGEDRFQSVQNSYLVGTSGYFLVIDATRKESLNVIPKLKGMVDGNVGTVPFRILINKSDLKHGIEICEADLTKMGFSESDILWTSAKTGEGVEKAFQDLSEMMIKIQ